MKSAYWNQFMTTGKIEDYLNYKMEQNEPAEREVLPSADGKEKCESDCTDRNGAFRHAGG